MSYNKDKTGNHPQIEDLKLVKPKHYTALADNTVFIALRIPNKHLEKTALIRSIVPTGSYKTSLDAPQKSLSLLCKYIEKFKNELDG